jgi:hypothetical protein
LYPQNLLCLTNYHQHQVSWAISDEGKRPSTSAGRKIVNKAMAQARALYSIETYVRLLLAESDSGGHGHAA